MDNFWCNILPIVVGLGGAWIGGLIGWYMRRSRIAELESQVSDKEAESQHLRNNNEMMGIRLENFQNEYTRVSANFNALEEKHIALNDEYAVLSTANRVLSAQLEEANFNLKELENKPIHTLVETTRVENGEQETLRNELINIQTELAQKNNYIISLQNKFEELEHARSLLLKESETRESAQNTEGVISAGTENTLREQNLGLSAIETKHHELESAYAQLQADYEKRGLRLAEAYASKEEWRQAFIEMELKVDALETKLSETRVQPAAEIQNNHEWEQSFHELNKKYHSLAEEIEELTTKNNDWEAAFTQLDNEYANLVAQNKATLQTEPAVVYEKVVEKDEDLERELIYLQDAKAQLEITRIKLENELEILRGRYEELAQERSTSNSLEKADNTRFEYLEAQNEKLQQEIETIKAEAAAKEQQLTETHKVSSNLWQKRYTNILNEIDDYKAQLTSLKSVQTGFDEKNKEWESMYDELVSAYQEKHEAYQALLEKNSQLETKSTETEEPSIEDVSLEEPKVVLPLETVTVADPASIEDMELMTTVEDNEMSVEVNVSEPESIAVVAEAAPADDLKIIEGVGPKIEDVLKNAGILTFEQLAKTPAEQISAILGKAGSQFKMHDPATWSTQAELAANKEWEKLKAYQDYLLGGRDTASN